MTSGCAVPSLVTHQDEVLIAFKHDRGTGYEQEVALPPKAWRWQYSARYGPSLILLPQIDDGTEVVECKVSQVPVQGHAVVVSALVVFVAKLDSELPMDGPIFWDQDGQVGAELWPERAVVEGHGGSAEFSVEQRDADMRIFFVQQHPSQAEVRVDSFEFIDVIVGNGGQGSVREHKVVGHVKAPVAKKSSCSILN